MASVKNVPQVSRAKSSHTASEIRPAFPKKEKSAIHASLICRMRGAVDSTATPIKAETAEVQEKLIQQSCFFWRIKQ